MNKIFYRGFSTANWKSNKRFTLTNADLVKRDLLNHIYTIKGTRPHMPDFGTRIPTITFEPNDEETRAIVEEDLRSVIDYDPRVELLDISVITLEDNNAIYASLDILYVEFNIQDELNIEIATQ